ncbi:F0F1 ATP synthase subunit A [Nitrosophilus kaiyonis]|uniref:F0F1 ATP synthase subunit A n=1 Tax=Nitrosophilus kaiyonis TaxID=2930200 RepID=UPI00248FF2AF|nr:F0F1 ATP synthase subunit A [Nitrosophilus kaiyonis]
MIEKTIVIPQVAFKIEILNYAVPVTDAVVTSWGLILFIWLISYIITRNLSITKPSKVQIFAEAIVIATYDTIKSVFKKDPWGLVPFIGSIWIYVGFLNLVDIIPYLHNPTRDLSVTAALATIVFFSIHYYGIKYSGLKNYLKKYIEPIFILLPLNIFGDFARIFAMAIRLFGNMLSWELIVAILALLAGLLVPVPMIILSLVGDVIQAYLFGMLAFIFIVGGITAQTKKGV